MHTKTIYDYIANKYNYRHEARKYLTVDGKRIGYLESLILNFASKHALIQAASVREYLKQQDIQTDLRRIHDALQRLLKKGIVEKTSRGIYKLTEYGKKLLSTLLADKAGKEIDSKAAAAGRFVGGFGRYRLHVVNAGDLEDLVRQLYVFFKVTRCALGYLRGLLGRRFYRVVRGVSVYCVDYFIGGHGVGLFGKGRSLKRPLFNLEYFYSLGVKPREIGIDVFAVSNVVKPSVKAYFG
jgi:DNA-binding PadR family transcriptional regulator